MKGIALFSLVLFLLIFSEPVWARKLQPGFNKQELLDVISISAKQLDAAFYQTIPAPKKYTLAYRSPVVGLNNRWDLWVSRDSVAVISIRGTRRSGSGWLENFYAAMVPATGKLTLSKDFTFQYNLADNQQAAVHTGWLLGTAALSQTIITQLDSCQKAGITDFIIAGHSQGGAIAYLLTAYVKQLQKQGILAPQLRFKTYCLAAPKPGNLAFAYNYEILTAGGWAYNVVNPADWVPETPVSIQTLNDFTKVNPFTNADKIIQRQKFPKNLVYRYGLNRLAKPTEKAARKYQKYLGTFTSRFVKKELPEFEPPTYANTSNYARAGNFIVLQPDEAYYQKFPDNEENVFTHHLLQPYLYLSQKMK